MLTHQKSNPSVENLVSAVDVLSVTFAGTMRHDGNKATT